MAPQKSAKAILSSRLITKKEMKFTKPKLMEPSEEATSSLRESRCTKTKIKAFKKKLMNVC